MARKADFAQEVKQDVAALITALNRLRSKQKEWNAMDYGTTMVADDVAAVIGEGRTPADIGAVVFATVDAFDTVLNAGNATNLYRLL